MTFLSKLALIGTLLVLAACNNATKYGSDGSAGGTGTGTTTGTGLVSDPTSIAYFQQAIGDRVLFPVDQSNLNAEAQAILDAQANWLNSNTDYSAIVEGHADEQGTREYNLALGERRASAAREYLISRGVAGGRLRVVSYGKERPIEICSEEACYGKNRRAVTVLSAGLTG